MFTEKGRLFKKTILQVVINYFNFLISLKNINMSTKSTHPKFVALFFALLFGSATAIFGQQVDAKTATGLIVKNAAAIGLSKLDLKNYRVSDAYIDELSGLTMVYMQQTHKGIDVF